MISTTKYDNKNTILLFSSNTKVFILVIIAYTNDIIDKPLKITQ